MHKPALVLRCLYAFLILVLIIKGKWHGVLFNACIFIATIPLFLLARKNKEFGNLDAAFSVLFVVPLFLSTFFGYSLESSIIGPDKVFHAAAGFFLGWTAWLLLGLRRKKLSLLTQTTLAIAIAIVIGVGWEVYEWLFHLVVEPIGVTPLDSWLDLVADTLGTFLAVILLRLRKL